MTVPVLLTGILIAMGVFTALGWSVAQAAQSGGRARTAHLAHAAFILLGMTLISLQFPILARIAGGGLLAIAAIVIWFEERWSKLFPLFGAAFGAALLLGLPFAGR